MRLKTGIILVMVGIGFSVLSYFTLDRPVAEWARAKGGTAMAFWGYVTQMGNSVWMAAGLIVLVTVALVMRAKTPNAPIWPLILRRCAYVFGAVAAPGLLVLLVKGMVGRARPYHVDGGDMFFHPFAFRPEFASWPSGHATTVFAFAMALGLIWPRSRRVLFPLAALTAYSRLALGVHYTGDVVMGAIVGVIGASLVYYFATRRWKI